MHASRAVHSSVDRFETNRKSYRLQDVVKTRIQTDVKTQSYINACRAVLRSGGTRPCQHATMLARDPSAGTFAVFMWTVIRVFIVYIVL